MRRIALSFFLAGLLVVLAVPAIAADNGLYLGASVGQTQLEIDELGEDIDSGDFSSDDMAFKVFAGFRFITFLGLEGSYRDFGAPEDEVVGLDGTVTADLTGYDVAAVGFLPLGIADIFAKAGMIAWDADLSLDAGDLSESMSNDGEDPFYGVGFQLRFKSFAVRAEIEYFDVEGAEALYMYSLGGSYTF
jgi:OOP family OmpA-OmpF porin